MKTSIKCVNKKTSTSLKNVNFNKKKLIHPCYELHILAMKSKTMTQKSRVTIP
jgi:hypothetical protein